MEIFQFDRGEKLVHAYGSHGFRATRVAAGAGQVQLTCLSVAPGGTIGTHPATGAQLFLVVAGHGWVAGPDGDRVPITAGWGARWDAGEIHTSGTTRLRRAPAPAVPPAAVQELAATRAPADPATEAPVP